MIAGALSTPRLAAHAPQRLMDRAAVNAIELGELLGLSERTIQQFDRDALIPAPVRLGNGKRQSVRWAVDEIRAWLLAGAPPRDEWEMFRREALP